MKYNYSRTIEKVKKMVKSANDSPNNKYGPTVWPYHIQLVVKNSLLLAKKLKADAEVAELAAYLHDYASLLDINNASKHHLIGAKLAGEMLTKLDVPEEKITAVKNCILKHRGSVKMKRDTVEEKILASADAMAHFLNIPDMFFLAYSIHRLKTVEGSAWLKAKLNRSWNKILLPEGRELIQENRKLFLNVLDQVLKK